MINQKILLNIIISLAVFVAACSDYRGDLSQAKQDGRFFIETAGSHAEISLSVKERREYGILLRFDYDPDDMQDRARLKKLITEGAANNRSKKYIGASAPVRLKIFRKNAPNELVFENEFWDPDLISWGRGCFTKLLTYQILDPGDYVVRVESMDDNKWLAGEKVFLVVEYYPKNRLKN